MSMSPGLKAEFEAVIAVLAEAYGAGKQDVVDAARKLPSRRRGRKGIDDTATLRDVRNDMKSTGRARWSVAKEYAPAAGGLSLDAARVRLDRKVKKNPVDPRTPVFFPNDDPEPKHVLEGPFSLAHAAIAEVSRGARDREVNKRIARRINRIPRK
jgi:hypothetical protein